MVAPDSFVRSYNAARLLWEPIKYEVDGIFQNTLIQLFSGSTYSSRIKSLESTYLKAQKENYQNPLQELEDLFACQIIVRKITDINNVKQIVRQYFEVEEPIHKISDPTSFAYNDVHLFLRVKDSPLRADKSVLERKFEFQIKTFLQSAWQTAGHDIIYKSKVISFWNERIFSQVKALLELADNILAQIDQASKLLSDNAINPEEDYKNELKQITIILEKYFDDLELTGDMRRTSVVIKKYLDVAGVGLEELKIILDTAKSQSHQVFNYMTLSPADKIFILLFENYGDEIVTRLGNGKNRVLVTPEMEEFFPKLKKINDNKKIKI